MVADDKKPEYAAYLAQNPHTEKGAFDAACMLFPQATGLALWVAHNWRHDPVVIAERDRIEAEAKANVPVRSKAEVLAAVWENSERAWEPKDRIAALKLYADLCEYTPKTGPQVVVNNRPSNVMVVKDHGEDGDWEAKLAKQQNELTTGKYVIASRMH